MQWDANSDNGRRCLVIMTYLLSVCSLSTRTSDTLLRRWSADIRRGSDVRRLNSAHNIIEVSIMQGTSSAFCHRIGKIIGGCNTTKNHQISFYPVLQCKEFDTEMSRSWCWLFRVGHHESSIVININCRCVMLGQIDLIKDRTDIQNRLSGFTCGCKLTFRRWLCNNFLKLCLVID